MKFIHHVEGGLPESLTISETPIPELKANHVLVKVAYFGINRADTLQRQGKYPAPANESKILGLEVSGEVVAIHDTQVKSVNFNIGDKVFGLVAGGGYAEYVLVNTEHLMGVPSNISLAEAAGIAECFLTAYQALFLESQLLEQQKVLIHAGASGVGLAAIQLAKAHDCAVATTASSTDKLALCQKLGADLLINYKEQDFLTEVKNRWSGCDLVVDFIGGDYLNRNLKLLNQDGAILYLAMLAGRYADKLDMALLLGKRASIKGSTLRNRSDAYKSQLVQKFSDHYLDCFSKGTLTSIIDTEYSVADVSKTHQRMENNDTKGKLVVSW
ncbi:NAD(P)H-quinone oxidoreductase [Paraglaciecola sp. 2405UD69-4]|uniref:NAD(P)H-quinone oxidoreductase n=1 Tax=Paraglaciecola sp. 2405UD69-4 TaxID=3391836 RepID=UPI0039C9A720